MTKEMYTVLGLIEQTYDLDQLLRVHKNLLHVAEFLLAQNYTRSQVSYFTSLTYNQVRSVDTIRVLTRI